MTLWHRDSEFTKWQHPPRLQCDTWLWDDMPLNSPKRPPLEFYIWFRFRPHHRSRHVILHQSPKFYPNWTDHSRQTVVQFLIFFLNFGDRQTNKETNEEMDSINALSRSRCRERRLSKSVNRLDDNFNNI